MSKSFYERLEELSEKPMTKYEFIQDYANKNKMEYSDAFPIAKDLYDDYLDDIERRKLMTIHSQEEEKFMSYGDYVKKYAEEHNIPLSHAALEAEPQYKEDKYNFEKRIKKRKGLNIPTSELSQKRDIGVDINPLRNIDKDIQESYRIKKREGIPSLMQQQEEDEDEYEYLSELEGEPEEEEEEYTNILSGDLDYIDNKKNMRKIFRKKLYSSYPEYINKEIKLITFIPHKDLSTGKFHYAEPYGSVSYMISRYPGDIDLNEIDDIRGSKKKAINELAKNVKRVADEISSSRIHYLVEFKAGKDNIYDIHIGDLNNGIFTINRDLLQSSEILYESKLLTEDEIITIKFIYEKTPKTQQDYDILHNLFRERQILRWSIKEIDKGFKILPPIFEGKKKKQRKISLPEALEMQGHIKIDEIVYINNEFIEVTNFVFLGYIDNDGKVIDINVDRSDYFKSRIEGLKWSLEEVCYNYYKYSPFKAAKRIYAIARAEFLENGNGSYIQYVNKILPLLESNVGILYQCKSQLEAIIRVFDTFKRFPVVSVNRQLQNIKYRIGNIYQLDDHAFIVLNNLFDLATNEKSKNEKYYLIEDAKKKLSNIINYYTIKYFNENGLNPIPRSLFPSNMRYKYQKFNINELVAPL